MQQTGRDHLNLIGPTGTIKLHEMTSEFYEEDMEYRASKKTSWSWDGIKDNVDYIEVTGISAFEIEGVAISTTAVNHTIATQAYRFEVDGKSIVISGDLTYSKSLIHLAKNADILVIDSGIIIKEGSNGDGSGGDNHDSAHATLQEVAEMAEKSGAKTLVLTHIGGEIDHEREKIELGKIYSGDIIIGSDFMIISP